MNFKNLFAWLLIATPAALFAQNVGIGTSVPTSPLTVISDGLGKGIIQKSGGLEIGFFALGTTAYIQTWSNHALNFATNNGSASMTLATNGALGIGTSNPAQRLHVAGGAAVIGNLGIGTTAPTTTLDINGGLRIRGTFPKKGSVLTSEDANGNANWADPVAFKTTGLDNLANVDIPENIWTRVEFNKTPAYNLSLGYQPLSSQFQAIEAGIYHFDAQFTFDASQIVNNVQLRMILNRNGNLSTIASRRESKVSMNGDGVPSYSAGSIALSTDVILQSGDIVWLELNPFDPLSFNGFANRNSLTLLGAALSTWFSGHLVARN